MEVARIALVHNRKPCSAVKMDCNKALSREVYW